MDKLYNIRTRAFGYINKYSDTKVSAQVLVGAKENLEKRYFQIKVTGTEAKALLREHRDQINDRNVAVVAAMTLNDISATSFDNNEGKRVHCLTSNLSEITMLRIGKNVVYKKKHTAPARSA